MFGRASPGIVRIWASPRLTRLIARVDRLVVVVRILQRRAEDDGPHRLRLDREAHVDRVAEERRVFLLRGVLDDAQRLVGHQVADPQAFVPRAGVVPVAALRVPRAGRGSRLSAVTMPPWAPFMNRAVPAARRLDRLAERADQVGAEDADAVAEDFGVDRVVDERGDRLALRADRLDDAHPPVVEVGGVVVVGDLPLRLARRDLDRRPAGGGRSPR